MAAERWTDQAIVPAEVVSNDLAVSHLGHPRADDSPTLEALIGQWLHAKGQRSQSARTIKEYAAVTVDFRADLHLHGLELDSPRLRDLAAAAQAWAARPRLRDGRQVSPATHNRRLAIMSSFYAYAKRHGLEVRNPRTGELEPVRNPVELVERAKVQPYASAQPLALADVTARLAAIDRTRLAGKRDYALLSVALTTGRRLSELAGLTWGDVTPNSSRAILSWMRTKGGKVMYDKLSQDVTDALLAWVYAYHGAAAGTLPPQTPLWVSLATNGTRGHPLTIDALADVYKKHLGTSKAHSSRHTFAVAMEQAGAKLTDIQARLGHSNVATTGLYLNKLKASENAYADDLAALFGLASPPR